MTRAVLLVCPAIALITVVLLGGGGTVQVVLSVLVGAAAGTVLWSVEGGRVRRLARTVNRWAGEERSHRLELRGGEEWRQLGTAVNALGTQLRDVRRELRSLVPWTDRLVSSLEEAAVVFDPDRRLVAANRAATTFLNLPTDGSVPTALSALGSAAAADAVEEAESTGRIITLDERRGGHEVRVTASPLDDHVLVVVTDRTRQRQVEELRRDFVTNASHELKTPVASITALTEALRVAPEDRRASLVERLEEESARLTRLVRDLLDLRQLEAEDRPAARVPVDLVTLVRGAVATHAAAAEGCDVTVHLAVPDSAVVVGVESELRLVVDNLVANAVQYNEAGGEVRIALAADDGEQVLTVADTGIGIPQASVSRVFERFYRVDVARSRDRGGTGLGLSLVRNAVERHHGRVSVESLLGAGTTFTVRLPVGQPDR